MREVKHIYVYEQDTFVPTSNSPRRIVEVKTPAFALRGWIDLTGMEEGGRIAVDFFVSIDERGGKGKKAFFEQPGIW